MATFLGKLQFISELAKKQNAKRTYQDGTRFAECFILEILKWGWYVETENSVVCFSTYVLHITTTKEEKILNEDF